MVRKLHPIVRHNHYLIVTRLLPPTPWPPFSPYSPYFIRVYIYKRNAASVVRGLECPIVNRYGFRFLLPSSGGQIFFFFKRSFRFREQRTRSANMCAPVYITRTIYPYRFYDVLACVQYDNNAPHCSTLRPAN